VNAPCNKTALLIVADDPLIADTLGDFPGRDYTVITASEPQKTILRTLLAHDNPGISRMTRYNRIDTLGRVKRPPVQERPETPPTP